MVFARYGSKPDEMSLADARIKVARLRVLFDTSGGLEPFSDTSRTSLDSFKTFDDLAKDWLRVECSRLKHPEIPARIYNKEIKPHIGTKNINSISGIDIGLILETVNATDRPTIANDTLLCLKQIFAHGTRKAITNSNPAAAYTNKQAGGAEKSRQRYLTYKEVATIFKTLREQRHHFMMENYIALAFLLLLGVRKSELTQAKWAEFDLEQATWDLPAERTKTKSAICIPLPTQVIPLLKFLKILAQGSEYIFPTRRSGAKGHISNDTLNHAVANLFGMRTGKNDSSTGNVFGLAGISHFVIHDLRRSCRTFLQELEVASDVAEKCLNHRFKGVKAVYARFEYYEERKDALQKLADYIYPLLDDPRLTLPI